MRFIPVIRTVLSQHQRNGIANVKFNPLEMNLSIETAIARLRDAFHSLAAGLTTHPDIDQETIKQVWPEYKVISDGTNVLVIGRGTDQPTEIELIVQAKTALAVLRTDEAGFVEDLTAFARLLGQRYLQGQVDIIGDLSESLQHRIMSENDVVFISDGQKKHHMI
jgi:hypothetical protein